MQGRCGVVEHAGAPGDVAHPHDHTKWLLAGSTLAIPARTEVGIVSENRADADDDRIDRVAAGVDVGTRLRGGDPPTGAIRRSDATIEGGGGLPGHERSAVSHREGPWLIERHSLRNEILAHRIRSPEYDDTR